MRSDLSPRKERGEVRKELDFEAGAVLPRKRGEVKCRHNARLESLPRLMRGHPGARFALGGGDLGIRHLLGDLAAHGSGIDAALQRGEIEPFMRGDQI